MNSEATGYYFIKLICSNSLTGNMHPRTVYDKYFKVKNSRITSPGKFEGELAYLPYYYELYLHGFVDNDDGNIVTIKITTEDRKLFPEIPKRKRVIKFIVTKFGFVIEV